MCKVFGFNRNRLLIIILSLFLGRKGYSEGMKEITQKIRRMLFEKCDSNDYISFNGCKKGLAIWKSVQLVYFNFLAVFLN